MMFTRHRNNLGTKMTVDLKQFKKTEHEKIPSPSSTVKKTKNSKKKEQKHEKG